jgi:ATP phosphoribosyltransferase regulatory subunit
MRETRYIRADMNPDTENRALLPAGLHDLLPPEAAHEASIIRTLLGVFARHGYDQVRPPLVEFETGLLGDAGQSLADQMFRVMDPVSQRMMGVRADMTLQVARIAETRLVHAPRPLRLSYADHVLQVRGSQLRPERQFVQAGIELIGSAALASDVEIVVLAGEALRAVGVATASIDLNSPAIVAHILDELDLAPAETAAIRAALDHKDAATVRQLGGRNGLGGSPTLRLLEALIGCAGGASEALERLRTLPLPAAAAAEVSRLAAVVDGIRRAAPELSLTLDPVEYRGFEYQTSVSFTAFARGVRGELGRGGRYVTRAGEPATGFSLYLDSIMRAVGPAAPADRLFLPFATPAPLARELRAQGWIAVTGLDPVADDAAEARRLGCSHLLGAGGVPVPVAPVDMR